MILFVLVSALLLNPSAVHASDWVTASDSAACGIAADPAANSSAGSDPETLPDDGSAWQVGTRRWTLDWEKSYSDFVRDQVKSDLLKKHHLPASCTLWPVYVRAIFARTHNLPFLYSGGKSQLSQSDKGFRGPLLKWSESTWEQSLDEDERFRAFLNALIGRVLSTNIPRNLYPPAVFDNGNTQKTSIFVRPGALITSNGHTKLVSGVDPNLWWPLRVKSATTPTREQYISEDRAMFSNPPDNWLALWRWPIFCGHSGGWKLQESESMPGYSLVEQRDFAQSPTALAYKKAHGWIPLLGGYLEEIIRSPSIVIPPRDTFAHEMHALTEYLRVRLEIVDIGLEMGRRLTPAQKRVGTQFDEDYSTPKYDGDTDAVYRGLEETFKNWGKRMQFSDSDFRAAATAEVLEDGPIKTTLYFFVRAKRAGMLASDPDASAEERWGVPFLRSLVQDLPGTIVAADASVRSISTQKAQTQAQVDKDKATVLAARVVANTSSGVVWLWSTVFGPVPTREQKQLAALTPTELAQREQQAQANADAGKKQLTALDSELAAAVQSAQAAREELAALKKLGY